MIKTTLPLPEYVVWNETDDVPAAPNPMTGPVALQFIHDFRRQYRRQGFYLTAKGQRIKPDEVELKLEPCTAPPEATAVEKELIALLADMEAARAMMDRAKAAVLAKFKRGKT